MSSSYGTLVKKSNEDIRGEKDIITSNSMKNVYKVDVESLPDKKGLVIKHVEYLVTSEKHQSKVN